MPISVPTFKVANGMKIKIGTQTFNMHRDISMDLVVATIKEMMPDFEYCGYSIKGDCITLVTPSNDLSGSLWIIKKEGGYNRVRISNPDIVPTLDIPVGSVLRIKNLGDFIVKNVVCGMSYVSIDVQ